MDKLNRNVRLELEIDGARVSATITEYQINALRNLGVIENPLYELVDRLWEEINKSPKLKDNPIY